MLSRSISVYKLFLVSFLILAILNSCSSPTNPLLAEAQTEWIGKKLILNFEQSEKLNDRGSYTDRFKSYSLIHYFNTDCSICITELEDWSEFLEKTDSSGNTNIAFIASGDNVLYLKYLLEKKELVFNYDIYADKTNKFYISNSISPDKRFHSFVTDAEGKVVFVGNPLKIEGASKILRNKFL